MPLLTCTTYRMRLKTIVKVCETLNDFFIDQAFTGHLPLCSLLLPWNFANENVFLSFIVGELVALCVVFVSNHLQCKM